MIYRCGCINIKHKARCEESAKLRCKVCGDLLCRKCAKQHHAHSEFEDVERLLGITRSTLA